MELKNEQRDAVEQRLLSVTKYKTLEVDYTVDSSLIGGMTIRIGDRVLDSSIKTKLDEMAKQLSKIQLAN